MAGARRLLRELLRERRASFSYQSYLPSPVAAFSHGTDQHELQQAFYLHSSNDDEEHGSPPPGSMLPRVMGSLEDTKALSRTFSGNASHSFFSLRGGSLACSMRSQIRAGGNPKSICHNGHAPVQVGRYSSTVSGSQLEGELGGLGGNAEGLHVATAEVAEKLISPEVQAVSEVSAIIGDCSYPTALLQTLMDTVHTQLGLPWWGAIASVTIGIRLLCLPIVAFQLRSTAKLSLMRPEMERITQEIKDNNHDPIAAAAGRQKIMNLFKKYNTTPVSPFAGALLQAPIFLSFFFAIENMCKRLDSFKDGGVLLFTDLTAKDTTYILPVTLSAAMLIAVELNAADGMEGNPYAVNMKKFLRIFAVALCPISMSFQTGLFFYWIPSNAFSIFQSFLFKQKAVKELLAIPSTEHLAAAPSTVVGSTAVAASTEVASVLPDTSTSPKNSVRKKLAMGRSKSKSYRRK